MNGEISSTATDDMVWLDEAQADGLLAPRQAAMLGL